jgi:hypothetical protein
VYTVVVFYLLAAIIGGIVGAGVILISIVIIAIAFHCKRYVNRNIMIYCLFGVKIKITSVLFIFATGLCTFRNVQQPLD